MGLVDRLVHHHTALVRCFLHQAKTLTDRRLSRGAGHCDGFGCAWQDGDVQAKCREVVRKRLNQCNGQVIRIAIGWIGFAVAGATFDGVVPLFIFGPVLVINAQAPAKVLRACVPAQPRLDGRGKLMLFK